MIEHNPSKTSSAAISGLHKCMLFCKSSIDVANFLRIQICSSTRCDEQIVTGI